MLEQAQIEHITLFQAGPVYCSEALIWPLHHENLKVLNGGPMPIPIV